MPSTSLCAEALNGEDQTGEPWMKNGAIAVLCLFWWLRGWTLWAGETQRMSPAKPSKTIQNHPKWRLKVHRGCKKNSPTFHHWHQKWPGDLPTSRSKWEIFRPWRPQDGLVECLAYGLRLSFRWAVFPDYAWRCHVRNDPKRTRFGLFPDPSMDWRQLSVQLVHSVNAVVEICTKFRRLKRLKAYTEQIHMSVFF